MSELAKSTIDEDDYDEVEMIEIPFPNVSSAILKKSLEYCSHYVEVEAMTEIPKPIESNQMEDMVQKWYAEFVKDVGHDVLFELILASNYMDIKPLLELSCAAVAAMIKGKTPAEVRKTFDIQEGDFTPEEEHRVREENRWCEEVV